MSINFACFSRYSLEAFANAAADSCVEMELTLVEMMMDEWEQRADYEADIARLRTIGPAMRPRRTFYNPNREFVD